MYKDVDLDNKLSNSLFAPHSSEGASCDVIIVNYNAGPLLVECVLSVCSSRVAKIIVVDNDSTDDSLDRLQQSKVDKELVIIRHSKNLGFSVACNVGAHASTASKLLFLNPDCVMHQGSLEKMFDVLDSSGDIGMVGGFLANPDGSEQPGGRRVFPTPKRAFMRAFGLSRFARFFPEALSDFLLHLEPLPSRPVPVEAISGACMLVKRDAIATVGLWDEGYFLHCEDLDWCMRFKRTGLRVMFVPDAKVTHAWGACSKSRPFFVEWHKHHGMLRFYQKFFRENYTGLLWWLVVVGVWVRFSMVVGFRTVRIFLAKIGVARDN